MYLEGQQPSNEYLNALLLDPYQSYEDFHIRNYQSEIANLVTPRQFGLSRGEPLKDPYTEYAISKPTAAAGFHRQAIAEPFKGFDWNNVCIAGGFVLRMLGAYSGHHDEVRHDIDMFIYGLNYEQGMQKLQQIINHFQNLGENPVRAIMRSNRAITILVPECHYSIQIILRLYHHPAEILLGFDLSCVKALFDGNRFLMTQSAKQAIIHRCNVATGYQPFRTGTYEYRLYKYYKRGYAVQVPDFRPERIDPAIFDVRFEDILELTGLARLLFMIRYNKETPRDKVLIGDYDPFEETIFEMHDTIEDQDGYYRLSYTVIQLANVYAGKPYFIFEMNRDNWHRVFDGTWTFINAIDFGDVKQNISYAYMMGPNKRIIRAFSEPKWQEYLHSHNIPPEVGPLRFIGSLVEYLQSLPKVNSWYCQAYGVKTQDC
jgi:hypothetical protein